MTWVPNLPIMSSVRIAIINFALVTVIISVGTLNRHLYIEATTLRIGRDVLTSCKTPRMNIKSHEEDIVGILWKKVRLDQTPS